MPVHIERQASWSHRATSLFGTPPEAFSSLIVDTSLSVFGGAVAQVSYKALALFTCTTAVGAACGARDGLRRTEDGAPIRDLTKDTCINGAFTVASRIMPIPVQKCIVIMVVYSTTHRFVERAVQIQEQVKREAKTPTPSVFIAAGEWTAGAAASTVVGATVTSVAGLILGSVAGVAAAMATRTAVRKFFSRIS